MRWGRVLAGVVASASVGWGYGAACAATTPLVGPPPAWVKPAPAVPTEPLQAAGPPITFLLDDSQFSFDADGWTNYSNTEVKIQSSAGLQMLGALPFAWSPWSDTLTFHRVVILRNGQVIDLLPKDGVFTVLRRETGLAQASLTGELTALIQPEGLEVGDVLQVVTSVRHADPLFKWRPNLVVAGWDGMPVARFRIDAHWPSSLPIRWRQSAGWPKLVIEQAGGTTSVSLTLDNVRPPVLPAHAPARFQHGRQVEFTGFSDWAEVAAIMAPLYAKAAQLAPDSALLAQADLIAKRSADPKVRAEAALQLVQSKIRYLLHAEAEGGYMPQTADETWRLRYGDCKAKTVLLLALLGRLGLSAEPVMVSTTAGDGLDAHLPGQVFDHVLVRVRLNGRDYWLDGAREGDHDLDELLVPAFGWVLPLGPADAKLTHVEPTGPNTPQMLQIIHYDASDGVTAPERSEFKTVFRGDLGFALHTQLSQVPPEQMDTALKQYWAGVHTAFTAAHVAATWDPATGEETLTADGVSKLDWSGAGLELQNIELGAKPDIERDPGAVDIDAPYAVNFPSYAETDESVTLPPGDHPLPSSASAVDLDRTIAGVAYHRSGMISGNVFRVLASQRSLQPEITAAEARASVKPLTELGEQGVYAPAGPHAAAADSAEAIDSHPTTAEGHVRRGGALLNASRFHEALAEFDAAIVLDPASQAAWAGRAMAHAWLSDAVAATEADKADALGPPEIVAARARGVLAEQQHKLPEARLSFQKALTLAPGDAFSLMHLSALEGLSGDKQKAYEDLAALLKANPDKAATAPYIRATIEHAAHNDEAAARELATAQASTSEDLLARARSYRQIGRLDLARSDLDASIQLKPTAAAYLLRAQLDGNYLSGSANKDIDEALKLAPDDLEAEVWKMNAASHRHDFVEALRLVDRALTEHPEAQGNFLAAKAQFHSRLGQTAEMNVALERAHALSPSEQSDRSVLCDAEVQTGWRPESSLEDCESAIQASPKSLHLRVDKAYLLDRLGRGGEVAALFTGVDSGDQTASTLNNACYSLATRKLVLEQALALCDAALKLQPKSTPALDSRAFVLLRMGRFDEALAAYDATLAIDPRKYDTLYGRGLVEAKLGRTADSERDIKAALAGRPTVKDEFAKMGVQ